MLMSGVDARRCQYWRTLPYGIGTWPYFRLEDLPYKTANEPKGRGPSVSAGRGSDVESVLETVVDGAEIDRKPYRDAVIADRNSRWHTGVRTSIEAKSCINWYPSGRTGTFRIWKSNHMNLICRLHNYYFFLIYRINKGNNATEVGKIITSAEAVDEIIGDNWLRYRNPQYSGRRYVDLPWTRVTSELGVPVRMLRNWELIHA